MAVAPHTLNIDFLLTVVVMLGLGMRVSFLVKESLFRSPLGILMSAPGGIPVGRNSPQGLVKQLTERFDSQSQLILGITPEGTRSNVLEWKRRFALIAQSAKVPVVPAVLNYETKVVHFHDLLDDVSDAERILSAVQPAVASGTPRRRIYAPGFFTYSKCLVKGG